MDLILKLLAGAAVFGLIYWWLEVYTPRVYMRQAVREANELLRPHHFNCRCALTPEWQKLDAPAPIPMVLYCPACGTQHIDAPKPCTVHYCTSSGLCYAAVHGKPQMCDAWPNKPHRSHQCQTCKFEWRPADVATTGVATIKTHGANDGPIYSRGFHGRTCTNCKHSGVAEHQEPYSRCTRICGAGGGHSDRWEPKDQG